MKVVNWIQLPKRKCFDNEKPSKVLGRIHNKSNHGTLTAKDRIKRLNRKFSDSLGQNVTSQNKHNTNGNIVAHHNDSKSDSRLIDAAKIQAPVNENFENLDHMFNTKKSVHGRENSDEPKIHASSSENGLKKSEIPLENESLLSVDLMLDEKDFQIESSMNMIMDMRDSIKELLCTVNSLRKQVARIEMKSSGVPSTDSSGFQITIPSELFFDFDNTLAGEGFPISTCVELNDFERKLKNDTKYREKIVSIYLFNVLAVMLI